MFLLAVVLVALALLFGLTTLALQAAGQLRRPAPVVAGLIVLLVAGIALLAG